MENYYLNLCVMNLGDGGELMLEREGDVDEEFMECFEDGLKEKEWSVVSLEDGLKELDDYFNDYGERDEEDVEEWNMLKKEYVKEIGDRKGKFYVWGVEYDCELMFIED